MASSKLECVSWLLLAVVGGTEGRGLLLMGKDPQVVPSVAKVSEGVEFWMVAASEGL